MVGKRGGGAFMYPFFKLGKSLLQNISSQINSNCDKKKLKADGYNSKVVVLTNNQLKSRLALKLFSLDTPSPVKDTMTTPIPTEWRA